MNDASSLGPEAARHRAIVATRAGLRVVSLLDHVLEHQPRDSCSALRSLKRTLRAAQLNPLSLIETPVLQMALTQLQIIDDGGDPRVGNLARNLELYLALRRIRAANDANAEFEDEATVDSHQRRDFEQTTISGLDVMETGSWANESSFQDSPFINHLNHANATGFRDTVIDEYPSMPRVPARPSSRAGLPAGVKEDFADTVQEFPDTVPAAFA